MKKSKSNRGMLRWFGGQGVSVGGEAEEVGLAQVEHKRTEEDLTADFSSLKESIYRR